MLKGVIDWNVVHEMSKNDKLIDLLLNLPRTYWKETDEFGDTFLHYACKGFNPKAIIMLVQSGLDINTPGNWDTTAAHVAASYLQPKMMKLLCVIGADLRATDGNDNTPIEFAILSENYDNGETARVLIANCVRLCTARDYCNYITPELRAFERHVLDCRSKVVAFLRVKKVAKLARWDKFLLREIAFAVWATRYETSI